MPWDKSGGTGAGLATPHGYIKRSATQFDLIFH